MERTLVENVNIYLILYCFDEEINYSYAYLPGKSPYYSSHYKEESSLPHYEDEILTNICLSVPPALSVFSFRPDLASGDRVSVQCSVNRGDAPLTLRWTKDGAKATNVMGEETGNIGLNGSGL